MECSTKRFHLNWSFRFVLKLANWIFAFEQIVKGRNQSNGKISISFEMQTLHDRIRQLLFIHFLFSLCQALKLNFFLLHDKLEVEQNKQKKNSCQPCYIVIMVLWKGSSPTHTLECQLFHLAPYIVEVDQALNLSILFFFCCMKLLLQVILILACDINTAYLSIVGKCTCRPKQHRNDLHSNTAKIHYSFRKRCEKSATVLLNENREIITLFRMNRFQCTHDNDYSLWYIRFSLYQFSTTVHSTAYKSNRKRPN